MVNERELKISLSDGTTDALLFYPEGAGPWPGVLYLTDIGGIRAAQREAARRLCGEGYTVLMPNVFYRVAKPPVMAMALRGTPEFTKRIGVLASPLTPDAVERDARGYVNCLAAQNEVKDKNKLGVVGFCICGGIAMLVAAVCSDQIAACASFHGVRLYEDKPTSPHLVLPRIQARLLFGHAVEDKSMPAEAIAAFEDELKKWGGVYESETYDGALHGWTTLDSPDFNAVQAGRAYGKLRGLLEEVLKRG